MARIFITRREIDLISDWTKEYLADSVGQKIHYFAINPDKSEFHPVYGEVTKKVFDNPIELSAHVGQPTWESKNTMFGPEQTATLEVFIQARDLLDKKIKLSEGDYFEYGDIVYEIVSYLQMNNIFGQDEYDVSFKIIGKLARPGEVNLPLVAPYKENGEKYQDSGVQKYFTQERGFKENAEGPTADVRHVRERLKEEMAEVALGEGPRTIDESDSGNNGEASSFNHDSNSSFYDE